MDLKTHHLPNALRVQGEPGAAPQTYLRIAVAGRINKTETQKRHGGSRRKKTSLRTQIELHSLKEALLATAGKALRHCDP